MITPSQGFDETTAQYRLGSDSALQVAQHNTLSQINPVRAVAYGIPGVVLGMADTFAESLSFGLVGENDMEDFLQQNFGEFGQFFNENREALGAIGDIVGAFIPSTLAVKGVRAAGFFGKQAEKLIGKNAAKWFTSTGKTNQQLFAGQYRKAKAMGVAANPNLKAVRGFDEMSQKLVGRSMLDTLVEGVAADVAIAATMRESEFLFPEDMTFMDNVAMFGGFNVAFAGAGGLIARRVLKRGIDNAYAAGLVLSDNEIRKAAREGLSNIVGQRGSVIAIHAKLLDDFSTTLETAKADGKGNEFVESAMKNKTAIEKRIADLNEKAFMDSPIQGVTNSVKLAGDGGELRTLLAAYKRDPNMPIGLVSYERFSFEAVGNIKQNLGVKYEKTKLAVKDETAKLQKARDMLAKKPNNQNLQKLVDRLTNKVDDLHKEVDFLNNKTTMVVELDGTTTAASDRLRMFQDGNRAMSHHIEDQSVRVEVGDKNIMAGIDGQLRFGPLKASITSIDLEANRLTKVTNGEFIKMSHQQKTAVWDLLQKQVEKFEGPEIKRWKGMRITNSSSVFEKEFALEMIQRYGNAAAEKIAGITSPEQLLLSTLHDKFHMWQLIRNTDMAKPGAPYGKLDNVARALNLPTDDALLTWFESMRTLDHIQVKLPQVQIKSDIENALRSHLELPLGTSLTGQEYRGTMMQLPRDGRPVIAVMENVENRAGLQTADILHAMATQRGIQMEKLRTAKDSVIVRQIAEVLQANENVIKAFKEDVPRIVQGNESQGAFLNNVVAQSHKYRDDAAFRASTVIASEIQLAKDKIIESLVKGKLPESAVRAPSYQEAFNRVLAKGYEADLDMAMVARHSLGAGWDLPVNPWIPFAGPEGQTLFKMKLENTQRNKDLYHAMFGHEMPKDAFMPITGEFKSAVVTERGADFLQAVSELSRQAHTEDSVIRNARNMRLLSKKGFHLPPQVMSNKYRQYLIDKAGNVRVVLGEDTESALENIVKKEIAAAQKQGTELFSVPESTIKQYYDARSRGFFEMVDFSKPSNQTGQATGRSFGGIVKTGTAAAQEMIESILKQYSDYGREVVATVLEPEIQHLKLRKQASGATSRTVYDDLVSNVLGAQTIDTDSFVGKSLLYAESVYDENLKAAWNSLVAKVPALGLGRKAKTANRQFDAINKAVGSSFNPFKSTLDYMERTQNVKVPWALRKHAALMNEMTTAVTIRMFDVGMGVINIMSLAATLPPVIAMLAQRSDETAEQWAKRIGVFSHITEGQNAMFSPAKALTDGIHFMWSKEGAQVAQRAANNQRFEQYAAEQVEIFARSGETFLPGFLRWASKKASFATDWTERESRKIAWMTFYNIGKKGLGLTDDAAEVFAHQQANNTIADFRPSNRPAIFQGAAGMPLGLFTTYMWNYLSRFATLIETAGVSPTMKIAGKDTGFSKAAFMQVGLQSALFGGESLPGWNKFVDVFLDNYDGSESVVDRMNTAFGPAVTDVILNGTVANLPKLFGMEGISIGPRASTGLPFEQGISANSIAGVRLAGKVATTFGKMWDSVKQEGGINATQLAEIAAASNINKGVSNFIEVVGTGKALDGTGNIIEQDTRTFSGITSRIMGFKPLFADELRQENVRNRSTDRVRAELKTRLADNLQSKLRHGALNRADVEDALESYIRAGGNAESFRRYFQSQVLAATQSKSHREILDALHNSADQGRIARLLYLSRD